jgi:hypothetical protein
MMRTVLQRTFVLLLAHYFYTIVVARTVSTFAGIENEGLGSDSIYFTLPTGIALDATSNILYVSDSENKRIVATNLGTNVTTTVMGT